jgi:hypothetical protein
LFWTCPQCPNPNAGRLELINPLGQIVLSIDGAGFGGRTEQESTILEGQWQIAVRGTGGNFTNFYNVDVTYPSL